MIETGTTSALQDIHTYPSLDPVSVMLKLYEESRRTAVDLQTPPGEVPAELVYQPVTGTPIPLPQPLPGSISLFDAMIERTSIRFYSDESISQEHLATLLSTASIGDHEDWPGEAENGLALQFLLVAWRVAGLEPAVYRYEPGEHALTHVGPAPDQKKDGANLVLQTEFANAPLIILITGNFAAASARYGAWGHRQLLLRAGSAGHRLWLSSVGIGLAGTVFAGFLPRVAQRIAAVDGHRNASLLAYSVGYLHPNYRYGK